MQSFDLKPAGEKHLLYVMAASAEYGEHLRARIAPLITGVGPVEAALVLTDALARLNLNNTLPDYVISLGSAGSAKLEQTAIFQVSSVTYRDMDASALGFEKGVTPFLDQPPALDLETPLNLLPKATLATGASVVSGDAYLGIKADMVDMETYALKRACQHFGLPLIALRGISDGAAELGHIDDWTRYLHIIDEKLAATIDELELVLSTAPAMRD
jgi:adenosylhomocysteine nucleosidase